MGCTILVADNDAMLGVLITDPLEYHGYEVTTAANGRRALEIAQQQSPDLIILDLTLPEMDGLEVCRQLRRARNTATTPIIMISVTEDEIDKVVSFEVGADAFMTKPVAHRELLARVRALLYRVSSFSAAKYPIDLLADRRPQPIEGELMAGPIWIDLAGRRVTCRGKEIEMSHKQFELLLYFVRHPETSLSRDQLLQNVWGRDYTGMRRTVDKCVGRLRQKLEQDPKTHRLIQTAPGVGYCFIPGEKAYRRGL